MWKVVGDSILAKYFELENIWQKEWKATEQVTIIRDYWGKGEDCDLVLRIWETNIHGKTKSFAASEMGGMERWVFALPTSDVELLVHSRNAVSKP